MTRPADRHIARKALAPASVFRLSFSSLLLSLSAITTTAFAVGPDQSSTPMDPDTAVMLLPDLEVHTRGRAKFRKDPAGAITLRSEDALRLTHSLGEIDLVGQLQSLSGVDRGSGDYASGLSVDGADPSQTQYLLDGAPVIFPYRFGGIFSTFTTSHFTGLRFSRRGAAGLSPRLGGALEFESLLDMRSGVGGTLNAGIISSFLTLHGGHRDKVGLTLSGRLSYIDQIYGRLLRGSNSTMQYSFGDLNACVGIRLTRHDTLRGSFFFSKDHCAYEDRNYSMETGLKWKNSVSSLSWHHDGDLECDAIAYLSTFSNLLSLSMPQLILQAPCDRRLLGASLGMGVTSGYASAHAMRWGLRAEHDQITPQWASLQMTDASLGIEDRESAKVSQDVLTVMAYITWSTWLQPDRIRLDCSLDAGLFHSRGASLKPFTGRLFMPSVRGSHFSAIGETSLSLSIRNQPIHTVGLSDIGLASDFNVAAFRGAPVQRSLEASLSWRSPLLPYGLRAECAAFFALVGHQVEYTGQVMEIIDKEYSPFERLTLSKGYNVGASVGLAKEFGPVTGSLSYSYMAGRRHTSGSNSWWRSRQALGHTLKVAAVWCPTRSWTFSADFSLRSGRPYTPVEALYVIAGNIAMEYGERNAARLPLYHRLDLGATYGFKTKWGRFVVTNLVNLSLINALGHRNVEMQYFVLNSSTGEYGLKRLFSMYRFIPSLSYTIKI